MLLEYSLHMGNTCHSDVALHEAAHGVARWVGNVAEGGNKEARIAEIGMLVSVCGGT